MAEEALKTEETEELELPAGGIADFVMEDDELEEAYGDKAEDFGNTGIAQFPALAERMAKYGRNEDNMLAHVAEGELVIPRQFLEDEVMKQRIFDVLTEAGVEDPEAYVVGSESNDLNPTTGLPEFFLKKLFKGIGKAIKKVVKAVVKVVKKVAPIVLPIALAFTPLGPIYGAALGSGIGTLIQGGSIKDALKSALISGAVVSPLDLPVIRVLSQVTLVKLPLDLERVLVKQLLVLQKVCLVAVLAGLKTAFSKRIPQLLSWRQQKHRLILIYNK
jgi:hypothetical protein